MMDLEIVEWIEQLKCAICNNYLSHFPIHTTANGQSVCGRCRLPTGNYFRNRPYEVVSQNINFSCRYESEGCSKTLLPKYIPKHEMQCPYRLSDCITQEFTGCIKKVSQHNISKHCQEEHSENFLKDTQFEIDATKSQEYDYVVEFENDFLILKCVFEHKEKIFTFALSRRIYYKFKFTCKSKSFAVKYNENDEPMDNKVPLDSLLSAEEPKIVVKMYLQTKSSPLMTKRDINKELLNFWKCVSCSRCVSSLNWSSNTMEGMKCPHCQEPFYAKDVSVRKTIGTLVTLPCENSSAGCNFTGHLSETQNHQKLCPFGPQKCPVFTECGWTGPRKNLELHLCEVHNPISLKKNSNTTLKARDEQPNTQYIIKYSSYFFHLVVLQQNGRCYWMMQTIGDVKDRFRYEIEIDDTNKLPLLAMSQDCFKKIDLDELEDTFFCFYLTADQILYCERDQDKFIPFKIRISKI